MAGKDDKDKASETKPPEGAEKPARDPKRKIPELHADRLALVEHAFQTWRVFIPHGTEFEDLRGASYWAHLSHRLKQHDEIVCIWEDNTGEARCRVLGSGHGWVKVLVTDEIKYPQFSPEQYNTILPGHTVKYVNSVDKWIVLRQADSRALSKGHDNEGHAYTWLANYAKSLAA